MGEKSGIDPVAVLKKAVENTRPKLEVRSRRVGGATYQVPVEVRPRRATTCPSWLVGYSQQRREKTMAERCNEIRDAANSIGAAPSAEDLHKMGESNKAFAATAGSRPTPPPTTPRARPES